MEFERSVVMERTVVTPRLTLAGMADLSSQKLVHEMTTMEVAGMYTLVHVNDIYVRPISTRISSLSRDWSISIIYATHLPHKVPQRPL